MKYVLFIFLASYVLIAVHEIWCHVSKKVSERKGRISEGNDYINRVLNQNYDKEIF